jgi:Protein of unknown function (DUF551).
MSCGIKTSVAQLLIQYSTAKGFDLDTFETELEGAEHLLRRFGWLSVEDDLPEPEVEVWAVVRGVRRLAIRLWDNPTHEETYQPYCYWDCPIDDGQDWQHDDVTHWMPTVWPDLPPALD